MLILIKLLLIAVSVFSSYSIYMERFHALETLPSISIYILLFSILFVLLSSTAFIKNVYLRLFWASVFLGTYTFYETCQRIFGEALTFPAFTSLLMAGEFLTDSLIQYANTIIMTAILGLFLFIGILLPVKQWKHKLNKIASIAPIMGCLIVTTIIFMRDGNGASGLPSVFTPIAYTSFYIHKNINDTSIEREAVNMDISQPVLAEDIVLILDESVRGDYLDINDVTGIDTSLKGLHSHASVFNYGIAVSATNCSAGTNQILRFGGTPKDFRMYIKSYPSIWQYAKHSGYRTVYIDAQRTNSVLHNNMKVAETNDIDSFIHFNYTPVLLRDIKAAETIKEFAKNNTRDFIFVTKVGAHFPVNDKYPDSYMKYKPVLSRGKFRDVSDIAKRKSGFTSINWNLYKNSYKNTLQWNTGEFFKTLLNGDSLQNAIVIYTSDHGQNFHENNQPGINTHCSENPSMEEGVVPLVVIAGKNINTTTIYQSVANHFNKASHFAIFPTLLNLFGFDQASVYSKYGYSLFDNEHHPYAFIYSFFSDDKDNDKWMPVDPENIAK